MDIIKEVIIGGVTYTINLEEAKRLNLIAPKVVTRPVTIGDVPVGCVFRYGDGENTFGIMDFVLTKKSNGQIKCTNITQHHLHYKYGAGNLVFANSTKIVGYYEKAGRFISEIKVKQPEPTAKKV